MSNGSLHTFISIFMKRILRIIQSKYLLQNNGDRYNLYLEETKEIKDWFYDFYQAGEWIDEIELDEEDLEIFLNILDLFYDILQNELPVFHLMMFLDEYPLNTEEIPHLLVVPVEIMNLLNAFESPSKRLYENRMALLTSSVYSLSRYPSLFDPNVLQSINRMVRKRR